MRLGRGGSFIEGRRNGGGLFGAFGQGAVLSVSVTGCVNAVPAFVCFGLPAREASSFCDF